jgi:hypothetical protein
MFVGNRSCWSGVLTKLEVDDILWPKCRRQRTAVTGVELYVEKKFLSREMQD